MTAKKLTDDEIVKRLELCVHRGNKNYNTDLVLDLINRQQAEIESLKKVVIDDYATEYDDKIKSEARKEFANRLKNKIKIECNPYGNPTFDYDTSVTIMHYIDKLISDEVWRD